MEKERQKGHIQQKTYFLLCGCHREIIENLREQNEYIIYADVREINKSMFDSQDNKLVSSGFRMCLRVCMQQCRSVSSHVIGVQMLYFSKQVSVYVSTCVDI